MNDMRRGGDDGAVGAFSLAGLPAWMRVVFLLGVPSAIAMFLTWWVTVQIDSHEKQQDLALSALAAKIDMHEKSRALDMARENAFLYAICLNTADNDTARARCLVAYDQAELPKR